MSIMFDIFMHSEFFLKCWLGPHGTLRVQVLTLDRHVCTCRGKNGFNRYLYQGCPILVLESCCPARFPDLSALLAPDYWDHSFRQCRVETGSAREPELCSSVLWDLSAKTKGEKMFQLNN